MTYTRQTYMAGNCTHEQYYAQFVTPRIRNYVEREIGLDRIKASTNKYFNDIPLHEWDIMHYVIRGSSLSDTVCIAKEAARQLKLGLPST